MPVKCNLSSVWVRLSIFSQLSIIQYVGLYVFSLPIPFVMIARIYILCLIIIIKSEVWTITHCLGLGHETMVCPVCLSIFLWQQNWWAIASRTMSLTYVLWNIWYFPELTEGLALLAVGTLATINTWSVLLGNRNSSWLEPLWVKAATSSLIIHVHYCVCWWPGTMLCQAICSYKI